MGSIKGELGGGMECQKEDKRKKFVYDFEQVKNSQSNTLQVCHLAGCSWIIRELGLILKIDSFIIIPFVIIDDFNN